MKGRKLSIYGSLLLLSVFLSVLVAPTAVLADKGKKGAEITVTAGDDKILKNTPVIIDVGDLPEGVENLATAIVYDGDTELQTQADDLDGDGTIDEIVFQLPAYIEANKDKKFSLYTQETGTDNNQTATITAGQGKYNETYDDWLPSTAYSNFKNATGHTAPMVLEVGDVVWIDTDWATMCVYISAGWRKSAFKHIYMKDDNWDMTMAKWDPWTDWQVQWTRQFWEADYGWHDGNDFGNTSDTVEMLKVGPVRCILQTKSGIGYNGALGKHDTLRALRTFTFYNGFAGIHQNIRLTGGDEVAASTGMTALYGGPLQFTTKILDFSANTSATPWTSYPKSNGFDKVYAPGTPNKGGNSDRYQAVDSNRVLDLTKATATYFGMYSSASKNGYMLNFALGENATAFIKDHITSIDWSDGEIVVKQEYEKFPLEGINRVLVPFSGSGAGTDVGAHMDALNDAWATELDVEVSEPAAAPGFELLLTIVVATGLAVMYKRKQK
ncbi:MAG: DUF4861 family protein [Candidatus Heimdallarchaeota archaeon]|nr:MAG: DUF4861 family protein [Candidatus Heimdallarchaeota archaeon]